MGRVSAKWVTRGSVLYFALATVCLVWPIYPRFGNSIEPRVLGLPWSLVWVLIVIGCNTVVLGLLLRSGLIDHRELTHSDTGEPEG